jgi:hypothetical protein
MADPNKPSAERENSQRSRPQPAPAESHQLTEEQAKAREKLGVSEKVRGKLGKLGRTVEKFLHEAEVEQYETMIGEIKNRDPSREGEMQKLHEEFTAAMQLGKKVIDEYVEKEKDGLSEAEEEDMEEKIVTAARRIFEARMRIVQERNKLDLGGNDPAAFENALLEDFPESEVKERARSIIARARGEEASGLRYWNEKDDYFPSGVNDVVVQGDLEILNQLSQRPENAQLRGSLQTLHAAIARVWNSNPLELDLTQEDVKNFSVPSQPAIRIDPRMLKFGRGALLLFALIYGLFSVLRGVRKGAPFEFLEDPISLGYLGGIVTLTKPKAVGRFFSGKPQEGVVELEDIGSVMSSIEPLKGRVDNEKLATAISKSFHHSKEDKLDELRSLWKDGYLENNDLSHGLFHPFPELREALVAMNWDTAPYDRARLCKALYAARDPEKVESVVRAIKSWGPPPDPSTSS